MASLVYVALMVAFFWPFLRGFAENLIGPPEDNMQDLWNAWYTQFALGAGPREFFRTALIRFPEGTSLHHHSWSYPNLAPVFVTSRLLGLQLTIPSLVVLQNTELLLSVYLSAIGAFLLARRFTGETTSATLAGFVFGFSSFHVAHLQHHIHVATIQFVPFLVWFFLEAVETGKRRYVLGSIAMLALSALSSWYYLVYGGLYLVFHYAFTAIRERRLVVRSAAVPALVTLIGVVLVLSPLIVPMVLEEIRNVGARAPGYAPFNADLAAYVVFPPNHLLSSWTASIRSRFAGTPWEATTYLGLPVLALFGWALYRRRHLDAMPFLLAGAAFFAVVASGSSFDLVGTPLFPSPARLLRALPFMRNVGASARAAVFVQLFVAIGAGLALKELLSRFAGHTWKRRGALATIAVIVGLDFLPVGLETTRVEGRPAYDVIVRDPDVDFGILDLPLGYVRGNRYMMFQLFHQRPIVFASISRIVEPALADRLDLRDLDHQKNQLREGRVKYVVLHKDEIEGYTRAGEFREKYARYIQTYDEVYSDARTSVLRVY